MWAILRRALVGAGALSVLVACSGSSPAGPASSRAPGSSAPTGSTGPVATTTPAPQSSAAAPTSQVPTSVPPPVSGNISQTVASGTSAPLPKVGLGSTARFHRVALTAGIADAARVQAQAHIPGEIAGPALAFTLQLTNRGRASLDLGTNIAVTAQDADGVPFAALTSSTHPVAGSLRAGGHASGRYLFHLPDNTKNPVTIEVTYAATAEVARFAGPIS